MNPDLQITKRERGVLIPIEEEPPLKKQRTDHQLEEMSLIAQEAISNNPLSADSTQILNFEGLKDWKDFVQLPFHLIKEAINIPFLAGPNKGLTPLLQAVIENKWDIVWRMLELNPQANIDTSPAEGLDKGITPFWMAIHQRQWDLVTKMLELNPHANIDASPAEGLDKGITPFWMATSEQQWDLVTKMLELNPHANIEVSPAKGPHEGKTVLWLAANAGKWDLVLKILELNPKANIDATPAVGTDNGITCLWLVAWKQQWDLVKKMLELNPYANTNTTPLAEGVLKGKKIIDFVKMKIIEDDKNLSSVISYLIINNINKLNELFSPQELDYMRQKGWENNLTFKNSLPPPGGLKPPQQVRYLDKWSERILNLQTTFNRLLVIYYDPLNNPTGQPFDILPMELKILVISKVIKDELPELASFPIYFLLEKLAIWAKIYEANSRFMARYHIAILAFKEFRWQNGLLGENFSKNQKKDFHLLIRTCLEEFENEQPTIQYNQEIRERIVKEIGKNQHLEKPKLNKEFIEEAIKNAMIPQESSGCSIQ